MRLSVYRVRWSRVGPDGDPSDTFGSSIGRGYVDLFWEVKWPYPTGGSIFDPTPGLSRMRFRLEFFDGDTEIETAEVIGSQTYRVALFRGGFADFFSVDYGIEDNWDNFSVRITPVLDDVEGESVVFPLRETDRAEDRNGRVLA